ncbi:MAG TPA: ABC transporter permease [Acidobacteriaceae bacterium]|nr:ABC transporter permease [Acidobacteriaceae bacterium]
MRSFLLDLKLALRQLAQSLGFTATAVLMLAFGIGATTAVFSLVEGILLRPLPFADPGRLVFAGDRLDGTTWGDSPENLPRIAAPEARDYPSQTHSFASMGAFNYPASYELAGITESTQVNVARTGAAVFTTLGVRPMLGRFYTPEEEVQNEHDVVLSYEAYRKYFPGNGEVLGKTIELDRRPYLILGVMPPDFSFPLAPGHLMHAEMWIPLAFPSDEYVRPTWGYYMIGRLRDGVTTQRAQEDMQRIAAATMRGFTADMAGLRITAFVLPMQETAVQGARPLVHALFWATAVVLLIACANLAGLLLVRAIRRQREIAVRMALGAPTVTLLRQALLESLVVSVAGALLGLLLAILAIYTGKHLLPDSLPRVAEISINWRIVAFALSVAVFTGLLCGLAPAAAALRTNVNAVLKEGGRSGSSGNHGSLRSALVILEIAIALVLLTASGLLLRSFASMSAVNLGFQPEHVTTALFSLPHRQYDTQARIDNFHNEIVRRLREIPGTEAVGMTNNLPASGLHDGEAFVVEHYPMPLGVTMMLASPYQVKNDYFRAMLIPLIRGRFFTDADRVNTQLVVIVNRRFAEHYWPGQDPIGKRMRVGLENMPTPWMTVVGEVADVKMGSPDTDAGEQFYQPLDQTLRTLGDRAPPDTLIGDGAFLVVRSALPAKNIEKQMRAAITAIDPLLPLTQVQTMTEVVSDSESARRFNTVVISAFAGVAVLLAVLGIYSVISFSVTARVQEMAIRMALGSQRGDIVRLIVSSGARMAGIGCFFGLGGALTVSWLLRAFLFGVSPFDPITLIFACACIFGLALLASAIPARRAASVDPNQALRSD